MLICMVRRRSITKKKKNLLELGVEDTSISEWCWVPMIEVLLGDYEEEKIKLFLWISGTITPTKRRQQDIYMSLDTISI
jgi:hypothetical protein